MGNTSSSSGGHHHHRSSSSGRRRDSSGDGRRRRSSSAAESQSEIAERARQVVGESVRELQAGIQSGIKRLEEQDHPAAQILDTLCSPYLDTAGGGGGNSDRGIGSYYSEDVSEDSRTISEDETTLTEDYKRERLQRRSSRGKDKDGGSGRRDRHSSSSAAAAAADEMSMETGSYQTQSDGYESSTVVTAEERESKILAGAAAAAGATGKNAAASASSPALVKKPLASSFAKRCYFTKNGIGGQTQHYEGLTLTGNVVLMLASAMKLKGCPTICDEDLRRVEQTYPNQFSRLPDELLLSSGWRRISKYCHFSNKPIPDGSPFFHSKQRLHPSGGYYFLLAAAVGMVRPIDVEPLTRDTLVLLETDYPTACDNAPDILIHDPDQWTLVDKFCFFSGGPINTDEDVYYQADFDGNPIFMLAFLSPSLTPAELYKLDVDPSDPGLKSAAAVEEVESVYDLTERDFDDLKLYHLGPCRALPQYILQPEAWMKVLPPHFLAARQTAMLRAQDYEHRQMQPHHQQHHQPQAQHPHQQQMHMHPHQQQEPHFNQMYPQMSYQQNHEQYDPQLQMQQQQQLFSQQNHDQYDPQLQMIQEQQQQQQQQMFTQQNHEGYDPRQPAPPPQLQQPPAPQLQQPMQMNHPYENEQVEVGQIGGDAEVGGEEEPVSYYEEDTGNHFPLDNSNDNVHGGPSSHPPVDPREFARQVEEEGAFIDDKNIPIDEAIAAHAAAARPLLPSQQHEQEHHHQRMDPPEDEPPSLSKQRIQQAQEPPPSYYPEEEYNDNGEVEYYDEEGFYESKETGKYYATSPENSNSAISQPSIDNEVDYDDYVYGDEAVYDEDEEEVGVEQQEDFGEGESEMDLAQQLMPESPKRAGGAARRNRNELPPVSPRSPNSETFSQQSPTMREAHEMLRRNRQWRSLSGNAATTKQQNEQQPPAAAQLEQQDLSTDNDMLDCTNPASLTSPNTDSESGTTWESGSDFTGSSAWTDGDSNFAHGNDQRSSRRALILQMAKARMKSNKSNPNGATTPSSAMHKQEEEKKVDGVAPGDVDLDLTGDLD